MSEKPFLTIGMAMCRNFTQTKWTVQMIRMMHPEVQDEIEILVCDNCPDDPNGRAAARWLTGWCPNGRYEEANEIQGTAYPRDQVFKKARGEWVICIDSHVTFPLGTLRKFIDWAKLQGETRDLFQGPMVMDDLRPHHMATHFNPTWGAGMWGQWGTDPELLDPDAPPKEIQMHGLGCFACRKDAWPGFNPRFCGFGAEEGYIHEKFRRAGAKCMGLPLLPWWHDYKPEELPHSYSIPTQYRIRNYLIAWMELGWPWDEILQEYAGQLQPAETLNLQMEFGDNPEKWNALDSLTKKEGN